MRNEFEARRDEAIPTNWSFGWVERWFLGVGIQILLGMILDPDGS